ncbi:MAG: hypothetical protein HQK53_19570 [Oligoflexia bacterium]|nr:hypothetical protein [Oligoflexia bacterium]
MKKRLLKKMFLVASIASVITSSIVCGEEGAKNPSMIKEIKKNIFTLSSSRADIFFLKDNTDHKLTQFSLATQYHRLFNRYFGLLGGLSAGWTIYNLNKDNQGHISLKLGPEFHAYLNSQNDDHFFGEILFDYTKIKNIEGILSLAVVGGYRFFLSENISYSPSAWYKKDLTTDHGYKQTTYGLDLISFDYHF